MVGSLLAGAGRLLLGLDVGISGFSTVYQSFGSGDGRIGIHGTNVPSALGQAVTNGCVRMSNTGITKLKEMLPLGVPVDIVA